MPYICPKPIYADTTISKVVKGKIENETSGIGSLILH
jgi:hypothetical protein